MRFIAAWALAVQVVAGFICSSDVKLEESNSLEKKGLALDDTTLRHCSSRIPHLWPNSWKKVTSLRLFRAWQSDWGDDASREQAWKRLQEFVEANDAKILVGTQISCKEEDDNQDWEWVKQLLTQLTPSRVMGLAIGNELELLYTKKATDRSVTGGCITKLWKGGDFWSRFKAHVEELDTLPGFGDLPVTSVFTGAALYGEDGHTFHESDNAQVDTFLKAAHEAYGNRFAYSFNFYPYFDGSLALDPGTTDSCSRALNQSACWDASCNVPVSIATARRKVTELTNNGQSILWVGETGWSSPKAGTLHTTLAHCPDWSSLETLKVFYEGFLHWDPSNVTDGLRGPDHSFWFTMRDSIQFGIKEGFGLIEKCDSSMCKIRSANFTVDEIVPEEVDATSTWWIWAFVGVGALVVLAILVAGVCIRIMGGGVQATRRMYGPDPQEGMRNSRQHP